MPPWGFGHAIERRLVLHWLPAPFRPFAVPPSPVAQLCKETLGDRRPTTALLRAGPVISPVGDTYLLGLPADLSAPVMHSCKFMPPAKFV